RRRRWWRGERDNRGSRELSAPAGGVVSSDGIGVSRAARTGRVRVGQAGCPADADPVSHDVVAGDADLARAGAPPPLHLRRISASPPVKSGIGTVFSVPV